MSPCKFPKLSRPHKAVIWCNPWAKSCPSLSPCNLWAASDTHDPSDPCNSCWGQKLIQVLHCWLGEKDIPKRLSICLLYGWCLHYIVEHSTVCSNFLLLWANFSHYANYIWLLIVLYMVTVLLFLRFLLQRQSNCVLLAVGSEKVGTSILYQGMFWVMWKYVICWTANFLWIEYTAYQVVAKEFVRNLRCHFSLILCFVGTPFVKAIRVFSMDWKSYSVSTACHEERLMVVSGF